MTASIGTTQISGLASGLDTASIISALMLVNKQPQVRIQNKIVVEQARSKALNDVLTQLKSLTTSYQSLTDVSTWADTQSVDLSDSAHVDATRTGGAAPGSYSIDVTQLARANQYSGTVTGGTVGADGQVHIATGAGTTDIDVTQGDTLDTVASKINGTTDSPVYASVFNGQLVLSNKTTGTAAQITGVTSDPGVGFSFSESQSAADAQFSIDGVAHTSGSNVVTDAMAGVTLTLKGKTTGASVTLGNPAADTDKITKAINDFVTQYNSTLTFIQGKLDENPVASPQTDADRAVGVLNGDSSLEGLLGTLRNSFADIVQGRPTSTSSFAQVGLSTGASTGDGALNSDSIDGKLTLDSGTFTTALQTNFDNVKALFTNATGSYSTEGLAQRLNDVLTPWTAGSLSNGLLSTRIDGESTTITSLQKQSSDWDVRLDLKQQMLQSQFVAMETALSQAQSQSQWLDGQIASLGNG